MCVQLDSARDQARPAASVEDAELIGCMKAGCTECFSVFFHRYCKLAFTIAFRILRQPSEAEDVVQDVFLTILQHRNPYDPNRGSAQTWLAQFSYFKALQHRRRLRSRESIQLEDWLTFENNTSVNSLQSIQERGVLVEQCLQSLSPQRRRTIELVHFDGYTLVETAKILNETLANTRNHYYRGLKLLRQQSRTVSAVASPDSVSQVNRGSGDLDDNFLLGVSS